VGAFGLKLTATDLVKLGELYVNGGRWRGRQIVSQAWVDESTSNQLSDEQAEAAKAQYGYLWWTGEKYKGQPGSRPGACTSS
jgi:CubicO group peptidase (beta-lactamase class C family)